MKHVIHPGQQWMHKRRKSLGFRLATGYAVMCLLLLLLSAMSAVMLWQQHRQFSSVLNTSVPQLTQLQAINESVDTVNLAARDAILATDPGVSTAALQQIEKGRTTIGQHIDQLQQTLSKGTAEQQKLAEELGAHSSGILVTLVKFSRLHKAGKTELAKNLFGSDLQNRMLSLSTTIKRAQELEIQMLAAQEAKAKKNLWSALSVGAGILLIAISASVVLAWRMARSITLPVQSVVELAQRISGGDLSTRVEVNSQDEVGQLQLAMSDMQDRLSELVNGIRNTVDNIGSTSAEIASGNDDLSNRTGRAAEAIHWTTSTVESLAQAFQEAAVSAKTANDMVIKTSDGVSRSSKVVAQVVDNMQGISESSNKISDIIGVIDSIAFQTNILALNAAVEAARAGEQGRGFAVVASEVRALAQRSASAAREIKSLIQASAQRVDAGRQLVSEAGQTMNDLISQVNEVSNLISAISAISDQQTESVSQVNTSINELDQATQLNATLVQQTSAAAANLRSETHRLSDAVGVFRLR